MVYITVSNVCSASPLLDDIKSGKTLRLLLLGLTMHVNARSSSIAYKIRLSFNLVTFPSVL